MSKKILIVVDMQKDFVDGALGTKEAEAIVPAVVSKMKNYDGEVICTLDTHETCYMDTQEGHMLPVPHCIRGSEGWKLDSAVAAAADERKAQIYEKPTFGSVALAEDLKKRYEAGDLEEVELIGLCTDICVVSNALLIKANMPELPVRVDAKCCAGVTVEKHLAALATMRSCQILVAEQ